MVREVYATRACRRKQYGCSPDGDQDGASGTITLSVGARTRGYIMIRRTFAVTVFVVLALVCAAAPARAHGPYHSYTVDAGARLIPGPSDATVMWQAPASTV
jgi:hypothetical protein